MISNGRVRQGEKWVRFYAPIIEPEEKKKPKTQPQIQRRSNLEERMFLLECLQAGFITQEFFDSFCNRKKN